MLNCTYEVRRQHAVHLPAFRAVSTKFFGLVHVCHVQCLPNLISAMLCCHLKGFWVVPPCHRVQQPAKLTLHLIARSLLVCTPETTTAAAAAPTADQLNSPVQQSTKLSSCAVVFTAHKQRGRWEGPCPPHCLPSGAAGCCICYYTITELFLVFY